MVEGALHESTCLRKDLSRKGAKTQSATAFLTAFFAPLRETPSDIISFVY